MYCPQTADSGARVRFQPQPLTRFQGRCLFQRTRECQALLQLAVLGVEGAQRQHPCQELEQITAHLIAAERLVEAACGFTSRWRG